MNLIWLASALVALICFAYFTYMLYRVRNIKHYNYLTTLLATMFLMFTAFGIQMAIGQPAAPFEFAAIFLLLALALIQLREEVSISGID